MKNNDNLITPNGRPSYYLTDQKWQVQFLNMRLHTKPYPSNVKKFSKRFLSERNKNSETYDGRTSWQTYGRFINDVLNNIRNGNRDFCYFGYQIQELLKFHWKELRTRYCDGYWEVWLEK